MPRAALVAPSLPALLAPTDTVLLPLWAGSRGAAPEVQALAELGTCAQAYKNDATIMSWSEALELPSAAAGCLCCYCHGRALTPAGLQT